MKKIISILLACIINLNLIPVFADESEPVIPADIPKQEEVVYEPIVTTGTIPYEIEFPDFDGAGSKNSTTFSVQMTDSEKWRGYLADEFGNDFLQPYMQKQSGYSVSGNTNRLSIEETDLHLDGKNGLDLVIKRKYDNQHLGRIYYDHELSSWNTSSNSIFVYNFDVVGTDESINVGFYTEFDDLYTHMYDEVYLRDMPEDSDADSDSGITYFHFNSIYPLITTEEDAEVILRYNPAIEVARASEQVEYAFDLAGITEDTASTEIGNGWRFNFPEMSLDCKKVTTSGDYRMDVYQGFFNDINGNVYQIGGYWEYEKKGEEVIYTATFWEEGYQRLQIVGFFETKVLEGTDVPYNYVIYDSDGLTYYFNRKGIDVGAPSTNQKMIISAVVDDYGNMIRYIPDVENKNIEKIIDTYGREVEVSSSGISYFDKDENKQKSITYIFEQLPSDALQNDSDIVEKSVQRFTVINELGERTIYDARYGKVMLFRNGGSDGDLPEIIKHDGAVLHNGGTFNIERIIYPDESEAHFKYKRYQFCMNYVSKTVFCVEDTYQKDGETVKNRKSYTFSGYGTPFTVEETDHARNRITVSEYNPYRSNRLDQSVTSEDGETYGNYAQIRIIYDDKDRPKKQVTYGYNAYKDELFSYSGNHPNLLLAQSDDEKKIYYTYHVVNGELTDTPSSVTYYYKKNNSWVKDYSIETTLVPGHVSVEYQRVIQNDEIKQQTKYTYNDCGDVELITYWLGDTNSDGLWDENDDTTTVENEYTLTSDDILKITQTISDLRGSWGESITNIVNIYEYDIYGNPLSFTDSKGEKTTIDYDDLGRPVLYTYPNGATDRIAYDIQNRSASVVTKSSNQSAYYYDGFGNLLREERYIDPIGNKTLSEYTYDSAGRVTQSKNYTDDNVYIRKTYEYDIFDKVTKEKIYANKLGEDGYQESLEQTIDYEYITYFGTNEATVTASDGSQSAITATDYDVFGRVVSVDVYDDDDSIYTDYTYDYAGRVLTETDPMGNTTTYTYDYLGNVTSVTDALDNVITYTYDALGNPETMTDAMGNTTTYVYDALGRKLSESVPFEGEEVCITDYYYDGNSNLIRTDVWHEETWENGESRVHYEYDNMNNLIKTYGDTDYVEFEYDLAGRMTKRTLGEENGQVTTYTYDDRNNLLTQTDPLGQTVSYTYDFAGNVKTTTDKNGTLHQNTYGTWGVIRSESTNDDDRILYTYTYDSLGRLQQKEYTENNSNYRTNYEYDVFGRVTRLYNDKKSENGYYDDEARFEYGYDLNSNVIRKNTYSKNGQEDMQFYTYDALNRLTRTDDGDIICTYDANGNISSKNVRGVTTNYTYNKANLPTRITSPYADFSYTYRLDGQKKSETDLIGGTVKNYLYDDAGRLVYEEFDSNTQQFEKTYVYDEYGNRIEEQTLGEERINYTYDANNRLTKRVQSTALGDVQKETNYFYDNNGNRRRKQELSYIGTGEDGANLSELPESTVSEYTFNINNMLTGFQSGDTTATYTYNAEGLRNSKTVNGATTYFGWENGQLVIETKNDYETTVYRYGADGITECIDNYSTDNYGTFIKNAHGDILGIEGEGRADYDAFGNEVENTSYYGSLGYAGEYRDEESGLIYLRARMYDPEIGSFISEDPIQDGNNWYSYCGGNPVMFTDPWGLIYIIGWSYGKSDVKQFEQHYNNVNSGNLEVDADTSDWDEKTWEIFTQKSSFARAAYTLKEELIKKGIPENEIDIQRIDNKEDLEKTWEMWKGYAEIDGLDFFSHGYQEGPEVFKGSGSFWKECKKLNWKDTGAYAKFYGCNTANGKFAQNFADTQGVVTYGQVDFSSFSNNKSNYKRITTHTASLDVYMGVYKKILGFKTKLVPMKKFTPSNN